LKSVDCKDKVGAWCYIVDLSPVISSC